MSIKGTGVRATAEEIAEARRAAADVRDTPLVIVHGRDLRRDVREEFMARVDALAMAHGLPKPGLVDGEVNHYGLAHDGEFTVYVPDGVEHSEVP